jgi:raffinose/stachyose/melibiose transport system permease protein
MSAQTMASVSPAVMRQRRKRPIPWRRIVAWTALIIVTMVWVMPFVFVVFTSLKAPRELLTGSAFAPPQTPRWDNFGRAWQIANLSRYGTNTLIVSAIKVPLGLLVSSLAAFALSRLRFRYQRALLLSFVMGTMIPVQVALIPLFSTMVSLGLLNNYLGLIVPYIAFGVPYQVFLLNGFFKDIPKELDEAARIDGASNFGIYRRIIMPLSLPALAALFILDFVATWNEFSIALVIMQSSDWWTIPLGLQGFQGRYATQYHLLNATIVMAIIPVLVLYLLFQRYFISGLTKGAIKG